MDKGSEDFLPFEKRKQLILNINTLVSHSISLRNTHDKNIPSYISRNSSSFFFNKRTKSTLILNNAYSELFKPNKSFRNIKSMKKISHKPHKQTKSTEEILLSQRKENIKGYLNQIIRIKKHNNLKLAEIEDKIIQHKFDVDTSKEISNKNIKQHFKDLIRSESFNVKVNKIDIDNQFNKGNDTNQVNLIHNIKNKLHSKTNAFEKKNNKYNFINNNDYDILKDKHINSVNSSDFLSNSCSEENNNNNEQFPLDKYYFNNKNQIQNNSEFKLDVNKPFGINQQKDKSNDSAIVVNNNQNYLYSKNTINNKEIENSKRNSKVISSTDDKLADIKKELTVMKSNHEMYKRNSSYGTISSLMIQKTIERNNLLNQLKETLFRELKESSLHKVFDSLSEEEEELVEKRIPLIYPECLFIKLWTFLLYISSIFIVFILPIDLAFIPNVNFYIFRLEIIILIIYFCDLILHFFVPYVPNIQREIYETNKCNIAVNYIQNWFILDLLSCFPFNSLYEYIHYKTNKQQSPFELLKLLPLIKTLKLLFSSNFKSINFNMSTISALMYKLSKKGRMILFFILFLILNHIFACIFAFIGKINYPNWITKIKMQDKPDIDIYIAAFYYNITTIFTCGFGDILVISYEEKIYNILLQSIGLVLYSYMVSSMMNILKPDENKLKFEKNLNLLDEIKMHYKINKLLYRKLHRVLKYDYVVNKEEKLNFIKQFPDHIKNVLINEMFGHLVKFKFFKNTNFDFVSKVILNLKPVKFSSGDVLVRCKCYFDEMYFIERGVLSLERNYKNKIIKIAEFRRGEHFGEINMLLNTKSMFDLVVKSKLCECMLLSKENLIEIVEKYKDIFSIKEKKATINYFLFEKKLKRKKREIDKKELFTQLNSQQKNTSNIDNNLINKHNFTFYSQISNNQYNKSFIESDNNKPQKDQHRPEVIYEKDEELEQSNISNKLSYNSDVDKNKKEHLTKVYLNNDTLFYNESPKKVLSKPELSIKSRNITSKTPKHQSDTFNQRKRFFNTNINLRLGDNDNYITQMRRMSHLDGNILNNKDHQKRKFNTNINLGVYNIPKKVSSTNIITNKVKKGTVIIRQTIQEGSMNMSQPKIFYSNLFDKLTLEDQMQRIISIFDKIKQTTNQN